MDGVDWGTLLGFGGLVVVTVATDVEPLLAAAGAGGVVLSVALWRVHGGRVWEGLGWLAWVGAAVLLVIGIGGNPPLILAFLAALLIGLVLQFGGRFELLPDVWRPEPDER